MSNGLSVINGEQHGTPDIIRSQSAMQFAEIKQFADEISKSGLFALTPPQALTLMLLAQSQGLPFIQGAIRYHVIKGKPSMKADVRTAEFLRIGGTIDWIDYTDEKATAKFAHPKHQPKGITLTATLAKMKELKISEEYDKEKGQWYTKEVWKRTPGAMLRATIERAAITMICPGIAAGVPTEDEIEATVIDVMPSEQTAHASLTAKLAARQAPLRERHEPVEAVVEELKATEQAQPEPRSDCRQWIEDTLLEFNRELQAASPGEKQVVSHQVANAILRAAIDAGWTKEADIANAAGKRDSRLSAKEVNRLWDADQGAVMASVGAYLSSKMPQAVGADDEFAGIDDGFPKKEGE